MEIRNNENNKTNLFVIIACHLKIKRTFWHQANKITLIATHVLPISINLY